MSGDVLLHHSPNLLDGETLEAVFVQRDPLATEIVERIRESASGGSKHYVLLVGPRGIGKTHLVSVIHHRVVSQPSLKNLKIAWLREEEYGVGSFLDLLIRIFRALATNDSSLNDRVEPLYSLTPAEAERAAARLLKDYIGDGTLLVIVENLDELFDGLGEKGQKQLRSYIQENPFWTIVATTQSLFTGVARRTSPFYGFFDITHLEEFSTDEIIDLISRVAKLRGQEDLAEFIHTPTGRARIRAVRHIAGGNPRIYVIFADFINRESLDELVGAFMRMLDELTPYYQHKMKLLSTQQRKIVEYLCDHGGAVAVKEIAQRCFIGQQVASAQLGELKKMAYVHASHQGALGREVYYELHEPLMRLCVELKKNRGEPIRLFVDFLRLWYTRNELTHRLDRTAPEDYVEREHILMALNLLAGEVDPRLDACISDLRRYIDTGQSIAGSIVTNEILALAVETPELADQIVEEFESLVSQAGAHIDNLQLDKAISIFEVMTNSKLIEIGQLQTVFEEALHSLHSLVEIKENHAETLLVARAMRLFNTQDYREGLRLLVGTGSLALGVSLALESLFRSSTPQKLNADVRKLLDTIKMFKLQGQLSVALIASIEPILNMDVPMETKNNWARVWLDVSKQCSYLSTAATMTAVAVRYWETNDLRVLLDLPSEQRKLMEQLLGVENLMDEGVR